MRLIRPEAVTEAMVTSNVTQADAAWSGATTYAAGAIKRRALGGIQHRWESVQASNLNHDPATDDGTWWTDLGASEPYLMFDGAIQSQTERADDITVAVQFGAGVLIDSLYFDNLAATSLDVTLTDATEGVVYAETFDLIATSGITDFWAWFFEPVRRLASVVVTDLPPYPGALLDVVIAEAGATVKCGALVPGLGRTLGGTQWGMQLGIADYSIKQTDDFGNLVPLERAYSKRANFTVMVDNRFVDELAALLATYRATPALWLGASAFTSTAVWGFYKDFSIEIPYPDRSLCSLEVEGLT